jgi:hypothetical protein
VQDPTIFFKEEASNTLHDNKNQLEEKKLEKPKSIPNKGIKIKKNG